MSVVHVLELAFLGIDIGCIAVFLLLQRRNARAAVRLAQQVAMAAQAATPKTAQADIDKFHANLIEGGRYTGTEHCYACGTYEHRIEYRTRAWSTTANMWIDVESYLKVQCPRCGYHWMRQLAAPHMETPTEPSRARAIRLDGPSDDED